MNNQVRKRNKKTYKAAWFHTRSNKNLTDNNTNIGSEYREDYTVKTFKGHTEGVLCVAGKVPRNTPD